MLGIGTNSLPATGLQHLWSNRLPQRALRKNSLMLLKPQTGIPTYRTYNPEKALNVTRFVDPAKAETLRLGRGKITDITISPRNDYFAVATPLGTWVYSLGSLDNGYLIPGTIDSVSVSWSPDGNSIAIAQEDGTVSIVDAAIYELTDSYFVDDGSSVGLAWSPNGQYIASASEHDTVHVWDTLAKDEIAQLEVPTLGGFDILWFPDSTKLVAYGSSGVNPIWDLTTQSTVDAAAFHGLYEVSALAWSPEGSNMAVASGGEGISIMDVSSEAVLRNFPSSFWPVVAFSWLDDGVTLAAVDFQGNIDFWDANAGTFNRLDQSVMDGVNVAAFSSDRKQLVTCTFDGRIIIWHLGENEPLASVTGHIDLQLIDWLPDGRNLLVQSRNTLEVVDSITGRVDRTFESPGNYRRGSACPATETMSLSVG